MEESKDRDGETRERLGKHGRKLPRWMALDELERDRNRVSLNRDRVKTITQKLSKLQQGLEVDKTRSRTHFDKRIKDMEAKIHAVSSEQDQRLEEADQQIENLMEALGQERLARELLDERKTKEGELLAKTISLQLEDIKQSFGKTQAAHTETLDSLRKELEGERVLRAETEEKFGVQLCEQVAKLTDEMQASQTLVKQLAERLDKAEARNQEQAVELEKSKKAQGELEEHVVDMLEDLCSKLRAEVVSERNDREAMEETLLKLIEETCSRVEGGLVSAPNS